VLDSRGRAVPGLTGDDCVLAEDGTPRTIEHLRALGRLAPLLTKAATGRATRGG